MVYSHEGVDCLPHSYGGPFFLGGELEGHEVEPIDNGTRFKGAESFEDPIMHRVKVKVEWDYKRVFD